MDELPTTALKELQRIFGEGNVRVYEDYYEFNQTAKEKSECDDFAELRSGILDELNITVPPLLSIIIDEDNSKLRMHKTLLDTQESIASLEKINDASAFGGYFSLEADDNKKANTPIVKAMSLMDTDAYDKEDLKHDLVTGALKNITGVNWIVKKCHLESDPHEEYTIATHKTAITDVQKRDYPRLLTYVLSNIGNNLSTNPFMRSTKTNVKDNMISIDISDLDESKMAKLDKEDINIIKFKSLEAKIGKSTLIQIG